MSAEFTSGGADLHELMAAAHTEALWLRPAELSPPEPKSIAPAQCWHWRELQVLIDRAAQEVGMQDAERRVLLLKHPKLPTGTTTNLMGALQILEPGEYARAHRHSLSALRFVVKGSTAITVVDGKSCPMEEGDLILTPTWAWHEHSNNGTERCVWFDGLDAPFVRHRGLVFFQPGPAGRPEDDFPRIPDALWAAGAAPRNVALPRAGYSPQYRYAWTDTVRALETTAPRQDASKLYRYVNPATGQAVIPTLDCYVLELPAGCRTDTTRSTADAICVVAEGEGRSHIGGKTVEWSRGDIFTLPHWQWATHEASALSRIFLMTDRELLARLGYLREETLKDKA